MRDEIVVVMERRTFLIQSSMAATAALLPIPTRGEEAQSWPRYSGATVIDALGAPGTSSFGKRIPLTASELSDATASGLTAVNVTVSGVGSYTKDFEETLRNIAFWEEQITAHPDALMKVTRSADVAEAKKSGRLGIIYGFQDGTPLGESLERLDLFYDLGVRIILFTYNLRNLVGDGCLEPGDAGLSLFGRKLIGRMNAKRVLVDLSHCGHRTTLESIEISQQPVAITHAGCTAIADLPRNKTDEHLRKLADKGGVFGVYLMPFLRTAGQPMAEDVIQHIEHAINICGEDHVGVGTDGVISAINATPEFQKTFREEIAQRRKLGISAPGEREDVFTFVPDLNIPGRFQKLAYLLSKRGHSDKQIEKIIGGNFDRLFREVWGG
ncbi:MAG: peptidase [Spartobacteria bacterium]|nr:peptidase [Spartobacteria bacterium]